MITRMVEVKGDDYGYTGETIAQRGTYYGKSTDVKPTVCVNNADVFYEMDTQKIYLFDADASVWLEQ